MGPIGSERVYPRRCGACFKPLLASFGGQNTGGLTDARVGCKNAGFCALPCVPSIGPIGSEQVYPRRCGASFKPLEVRRWKLEIPFFCTRLWVPSMGSIFSGRRYLRRKNHFKRLSLHKRSLLWHCSACSPPTVILQFLQACDEIYAAGRTKNTIFCGHHVELTRGGFNGGNPSKPSVEWTTGGEQFPTELETPPCRPLAGRYGQRDGQRAAGSGQNSGQGSGQRLASNGQGGG
eukprot:gene19948-biopygen2538